MKKGPTQPLGEVLKQFHVQGRAFHAAGVGNTTVDAYEVVVQILHAESLPVEVIPCGLGWQLWDPKLSTPVGWILNDEEKQKHRDTREAWHEVAGALEAALHAVAPKRAAAIRASFPELDWEKKEA